MRNTILIFDAEPKIRREYRLALGAEGYRVLTAETVHEALDFIKSDTIDLVVLELDFPNGAGVDYLYDIMNEDRKLKVIINSNHAAHKLDFHTWAADAFVVKSPNLSELKRTIAELLSTKSYRTFEVNKFHVDICNPTASAHRLQADARKQQTFL